jgi:hypothetical protein
VNRFPHGYNNADGGVGCGKFWYRIEGGISDMAGHGEKTIVDGYVGNRPFRLF